MRNRNDFSDEVTHTGENENVTPLIEQIYNQLRVTELPTYEMLINEIQKVLLDLRTKFIGRCYFNICHQVI